MSAAVDGSMLHIYREIADEIHQRAQLNGNRQFIVGISGAPGSGKSKKKKNLHHAVD